MEGNLIKVSDFKNDVQKAINSLPYGGDILFPNRAEPYEQDQTLEINQPGIRLIGEGSGDSRPTLAWKTVPLVPKEKGGDGHLADGIRVTAPGFGMEHLQLQGPTGSDLPGHPPKVEYRVDESLVRVVGSTVPGPRLTGVTIRDCAFSRSGAYGLQIRHTNEIRVSDCTFTDIAHAGAMFFSCDWGWFRGNRIVRIGPGTHEDEHKTNAYGVSLTHDSRGWPQTETS
jgi:hypothetical protein